jgi:tripartite ATP-independent transporter DctP family solute receptor
MTEPVEAEIERHRNLPTRRCFVATAAAASVFLSCGVGRADDARILKIGYILAPDSQLGAGARVFAAEVVTRTQNRYRFVQYPNSQLGGEVEMLKDVQLGTIDAAFVTGAPVPNFVPEIGVFGIPFLISSAAHAHALLDGPFGQELLKKLDAPGMVALAWGENGMRHLTNSIHPIATPGDLKGLKLRVPENDTMVNGFKALGADVRSLAFPKLYSALQVGQFNGQENPIATIVASKFYEVQSYLTMSGHNYDPAVFVISKVLSEDLSDADRAAFVEAARLGGLASRKFAADAETTGVALLQAKGMKVIPSIDKAAFVQAMAVVMPAFEEQFGAVAIAALRDNADSKP